MVTPLSVEFIKTTKSKNKPKYKGFFYTLNKVSAADKHNWVCERRATCNDRINTTQKGIFKNPTELNEILASHSHGPELTRAQILENYQSMKECANNSRDKTRTILSQGIVNLSESSIASLPTLESVKEQFWVQEFGSRQ